MATSQNPLNEEERNMITQGLNALEASKTRQLASETDNEIQRIREGQISRIKSLRNKINSKELTL